MNYHIPVLEKEVLSYLNPQRNENFIDCTAGSGGHTLRILERTEPNGKVLAIDQDTQALERIKERIQKNSLRSRITLVKDNFSNIKEIATKEKFRTIHGILFDLGLSSEQLEKSKRGFSFQGTEPLDMRYDSENPLTADKILNYWSKQDIENILKEYGEEQFAKEIANKIVEKRRNAPFTTTNHLVKVIEEVTPKWYQRKKIHAATKTFQALRIAVNDELESLRRALSASKEILHAKGRIVVISFHSAEDRIVKDFFKKNNSSMKILTKKPITPSVLETRQNPRSRSAKLRAAIKE